MEHIKQLIGGVNLIKYDYEITVNGNQAKLNKDIYLFRGNKNVHYYFAVKMLLLILKEVQI